MVAATASAQETKTIDNPEFANWSKFKAGASTTMKMTTEFNGTKNTSTITNKLLEVKDDVLSVETVSDVELNGKSFKSPPMRREVKKTLEIKAGVKLPGDGKKPEGTTEEGTEVVKVGNVEVKTKWYKFKSKTQGGEVEGQVWTSDEVPGSVVKMVSKGAKFSSTMELVEVKK